MKKAGLFHWPHKWLELKLSIFNLLVSVYGCMTKTHLGVGQAFLAADNGAVHFSSHML